MDEYTIEMFKNDLDKITQDDELNSSRIVLMYLKNKTKHCNSEISELLEKILNKCYAQDYK